jgi:hypothetical protein
MKEILKGKKSEIKKYTMKENEREERWEDGDDKGT